MASLRLSSSRLEVRARSIGSPLRSYFQPDRLFCPDLRPKYEPNFQGQRHADQRKFMPCGDGKRVPQARAQPASAQTQSLMQVTRSRPEPREPQRDMMAERVGFEPTIRLPVCRISSAVLSTTQPPLRSIWSAPWRCGALHSDERGGWQLAWRSLCEPPVCRKRDYIGGAGLLALSSPAAGPKTYLFCSSAMQVIVPLMGNFELIRLRTPLDRQDQLENLSPLGPRGR